MKTKVSKKLKVGKVESISEGKVDPIGEVIVDRISDLSDDLLVRVMGFLPVKDSARTCVLSKRWKNLRYSIPSFHFCCNDNHPNVLKSTVKTTEGEKMGFIDFVNRVMKKLVKVTSLAELSLSYGLDRKYTGDIDKWVEFAAQKQLKSFKLDFGDKNDQPYNVGILASPNVSSGFKKLIDLYLKGVDVDNNVLEGLFSNSPLIERLCVIGSLNLNNLKLEAPNLKFLDTHRCNNLNHLSISAPNLKTVDISAPNLNSLKVYAGTGLAQLNISAPDLYNVTLALYNRSDGHLIRGTFDCLFNLLCQFTHVRKKLSVKVSFEVFYDIAESIGIMDRFHELTRVEHLKITIKDPWTLWYNFGSQPWSQHHRLWPCALLKAASILQKLSIKLFHTEHRLTSKDIDFKWMDEGVPMEKEASVIEHYSHQNLKEIELVGFSGSRNEVQLVLDLLEISVSLKKLIIHFYTPSSNWSEEDFLSYKESEFEKMFSRCAVLLKARLCPKIDVVIEELSASERKTD